MAEEEIFKTIVHRHRGTDQPRIDYEDLSDKPTGANWTHGDLLALTVDDHTMYIKADASRAFTGHQSMGTHNITDVVDPVNAQDAVTKTYCDANSGGYSSGCKVYRAVPGQDITGGAINTVYLDAKVFDIDSEFDLITNYRFDATNAGRYLVIGQITISNGGGDEAQHNGYIYKNGAQSAKDLYYTSGANQEVVLRMVDMISFTVADNMRIQLKVEPVAVGTYVVSSGAEKTFLSIQRLA